jgi:hypothetical protein
MLFVSQGNLPLSRKNQAQDQNPVRLSTLIILTLAEPVAASTQGPLAEVNEGMRR